MSASVLGIIIGGLLPALLLGVSGTFLKAGINAGLGPGWYLMHTGVAVFLTGLVVQWGMAESMPSARAAGYAFVAGLFWAVASAGFSFALGRYGMPLGKLVPLINMNTLVAVLLALWIFAEWQQVKVASLLLGALLIVIGGTLVARS